MGCGALFFVFVNLLAAIIMPDPNVGTTIGNTGNFLAGLCFGISALLAYTHEPREEKSSGPLGSIILAYLIVLTIIGLLALSALAGITPAFYVAGHGTTLLRQIVLDVTAIEFILVSVCIGILYRRSRTHFMMWYGFGLLLSGLCMVTLAISGQLWTPLGWIAKFGLYLGGLYMLIGLLSLKENENSLIPLERALWDSEEKYRCIVETATEGIWITDTEAKTTFVNKKLADMLGYSPEEIIGKSGYDFVDDETKALADHYFEKRRQGFSDRYELKLIRKDGTPIWVIVSGAPLRDKDGHVIAFLAMQTDITERKRAEESLKLTGYSLDNAQDIVIWFCSDGRIYYANNSACKSFGYSRDEMLSLTIFDINPNVTREIWNDRWLELQRRCFGYYVAENKARDGRVFPVEITNTYIKYGGLELMVGYARDITERKRAEEAIRSNEAGLLLAQSIAHLCNWEWNLTTNEVSGSGELYRMFGLTHDTTMFFNQYAERLAPEDKPRVLEALDNTAKNGVPYNIDYRVILPDGTDRFIHAEAITSYDGDKPAKVFGIAQDITERKSAEEVVQSTLKRFYSILSSMYTSILLVTKDDCVEYANQSFCDYFDLDESPEELIGLSPSEMIKKIEKAYLNPKEAITQINKIVSLGQQVRGEEVAVRDGRTCLRDFVPLYVNGKPYGRLWLHNDITERKLAEDELNAAKMQAELYLDLMGHDISNMHQIAMGQLELAQEAMDEDGSLKIEEKELIETPLATLKRSARLIENVRKLQMMRRGEFKEECIDLNDLLSNIVKEHEFMLPANSIKFVGVGLHRVMANKLLHDVFSNLVGNAVKHSNGSGVDINVKLENASENGKNYYKVLVEDNGPGIPGEMKDKIFNRLQRGDTKARGLGLGLYIVKSLVDSYGGRVWVEDRVQGDHTKGSRFVVLLPAVEDSNGC
jgi:PAS domain S-box-containing protein